MAEDKQPKRHVARSRVARADNAIGNFFFGTAERTFHESAQWAESLLKPYNPDDLFQKDRDYGIYEDMLIDDQVHAAMQLKKDLTIGDGWDIEIQDSDDSNMDEIRDDLLVAIGEDPERPFAEMLEEILTAYEYGFSVSEKIWQKRPDGSVALKDIKTRHPTTWRLEQDVQGNVEKFIQEGTPNGDIEPNKRTLIHYINRPKFSNVYGRSDLRPAFQPWFAKRHVIRYQAIFLEKHASPMPYAQYDPDMPNDAVDDIFTALKKVQAATALAIPKGIDLSFLETTNKGESYEKAINLYNLMIGRSIMLPDLIGFTGSETSGGSFSLGKSQIEVAFRHIMRRRQLLEDLVNQHIVKPIVHFNHGLIDDFPRFKLAPITQEDEQKLAELWLEGVRAKAWKPTIEEINRYRAVTGFPESDEGIIEDPVPPPFAPGFGPQEPGKVPPDGGGSEPGASPSTEEPAGAKPVADQEVEDDLDKMSGGKKKKLAKAFNDIPFDYHKRVDFAAAENMMEGSTKAIMQDATPVVKAIIDDINRQVQRKKLLEPKNVKRVDELKVIKRTDLQRILRKEFKDLYKRGQNQAQSELIKGNVAANFAAPLVAEEFLSVLEQETFDFIGDYSFNVTQKSRVTILQALKDGLPLSAVQDKLELELLSLSQVAFERFSRTKSTEVLNKGRHAFFEDSGVVSAYQYSAILDGRTTAICAGLHGKVFQKGTEPIPPLHFSCRSLLVPITQFEEFTADDKPNAKDPEGNSIKVRVKNADGTVRTRSASTMSMDDFIKNAKGEGFATK